MLRRALLGLTMLVLLSTGGAYASGRPAGAPRAWCGWFLSNHLGLHRRDLWVARNWAGIGHRVSLPVAGAIVVWRHHVGIISAVDGHRVKVLSGNDGHRVRNRWRSVSGAIAFRMLSGANHETASLSVRETHSGKALTRKARHQASSRPETRSMSAMLEVHN